MTTTPLLPGVLQMEKRAKRSLSLKKLGQKKLNFTTKGSQDDSSHVSTSTEPQEAAEQGGSEDSSVASSSSTVWLSGLCNLGNTCYANSILQVLRFCPHLSGKVVTLSNLLAKKEEEAAMEIDQEDKMDDHHQEPDEGGWQENKGALMIQLSKLWQRMADKERKAAGKSSVLSATRPQNLLSTLREENEVFNNRMQQDAQEMLRFLLTNIHEAVESALTSLPVPPEELALPTSAKRTRPTTADGTECSSAGGMYAIKKRKLQLQRKSKVIKNHGKASIRKVTDFFSAKKEVAKPTELPVPRVVSIEVIDVDEVVLEEGKKEEEEEITASRPAGNDRLDFIKQIFQGEVVSQTHCYECDGSTRRTEAFLDVSLAVSSHSFPGFPETTSPLKTTSEDSSFSSRSIGTGSRNRISAVGPFSLSWALSQFCLREKLEGDNKYRCEQCGHLVEAERTVLFQHLPRVMTLHLNRFATHATYGFHSGLGLSVNKIGGNIAIPLTLSFASWCTDDCERKEEVYHLFAVVFHTGSSCSSGHYTSCVRARECTLVSPSLSQLVRSHGDWVEFDDEVVELLSEQEVVSRLSPLTSSTAYILFYSVHS